MLPKLEEFSVDELKKQLDNKKIDEEFLIEYVVKRDKVYNKLIDEVNRLRIEVSSKEEYTSVYLKGCTDIKGKYLSQQKEFIEYLENEKNRLAKECSYTYEGSLGRLLYVNEDIFNEVNRILSKYKEITGGDNK